jgi:hemerythrin-like domain-containing protein
VTATEELMREHGVVHRLMTVYQECADRLARGQETPPGALINAGVVVDDFVESYHEGIEEEYVFPAFYKAERLTELVGVLRRQHLAGRKLVERTIFLAGNSDLLDPAVRRPLVSACRAYARMYRAHAAHEDTVLFPHLRSVLEPGEFTVLGKQLEETEERKLGEAGFAAVVERIAEIERGLGIDQLDTFTAEV